MTNGWTLTAQRLKGLRSVAYQLNDTISNYVLKNENLTCRDLFGQVEEPNLLSDSEDAVDSRQWTQHHLAAADIRVPPTMALTPPQGEFENDCMDVNVRGPGQ